MEEPGKEAYCNEEKIHGELFALQCKSVTHDLTTEEMEKMAKLDRQLDEAIDLHYSAITGIASVTSWNNIATTKTQTATPSLTISDATTAVAPYFCGIAMSGDFTDITETHVVLHLKKQLCPAFPFARVSINMCAASVHAKINFQDSSSLPS
ncbi:expressed unknown protein [Seminavis robusta]|uniref:Uncharacterized protein n=1 Tax=Seminavis robusta TaxID=568900 RepID=A0A9N8DHD6_9STRA|nr:expressed unknown protein [Seminavis robusta]|eukprot:Sro154_g069970.1 n/a (152) ;mRNA; r:35151-35606